VARYRFHPLTPARWEDFERLFGARGACGGCWCMWFRFSNAEFERRKGAGNKRAMKALVRKGAAPGILAYWGGEPVGWCAVAPRAEYTRLERSRILKPVDDQPVWSVVCFFIHREHRARGLTVALLREAARYVKQRGGTILEGYPVDPKQQMPPAFAYHGLAAAFREAGFEECARRSPTRPIMRYYVGRHRP